MSEWIQATVQDLKKGDVFRFPGEAEGRESRVFSRWDEDGWVKFTSHVAISDRPEGLSILRPDHPVLILK